jgi:hypothetical protein
MTLIASVIRKEQERGVKVYFIKEKTTDQKKIFLIRVTLEIYCAVKSVKNFSTNKIQRDISPWR